MKFDTHIIAGIVTLLSPLLVALSVRIAVLGWVRGIHPAFVVLIVYWGFWCILFTTGMRRFSLKAIKDDYGLSLSNSRRIGWMTLLGIAVTMGLVALTLSLPLDLEFGLDRLKELGTNMAVFSTALANGFFEELYWRAFLFGTTKKISPRIFAYLYSAAWFAMYHVIGWNPVFPVFQGPHIASVMVVALFFTYLFEKSGSLLPPIVSHISLDILMFAQGASLPIFYN